MDKVKQLKEQIKNYETDLKKLSTLETLAEIDRLERKCVQEMWAIQSVAQDVGRDLDKVARLARKRIRTGV